ncbi:MAG: amino acid adenylation domain-containing protein, partial [Gammaproteobacteria bacterium]|nr:amino acid adenylation domain-containing protein [Gammaproteobacteria bacterium]
MSLLDRLRAAGIRVRAVDGELEVDAPRGALTPELRAELTAQKSNLLRLLSWSRRAAGAATSPLAPAPRSGPLPLSWAQQRLWFLDQLEPGSSAYNISWTVRLRGQLNTAALERAWHTLTQRHESLRTVFPATAGVPEQRILAAERRALEYHDLRAAVDERVRARLQSLAARPFDLAAGPLHRLSLLQLGPAEHILLVVVHHIVADGASMRIVFRELAALYEGELAGETVDLPPLPVQYADFAVWQRSWLQGDELQRQVEYWRAELQGLPPLLELPWDRPRAAAMRYRGAAVLQVLAPELTAELRRVSREQGCTLFMTMLAAFYVLLWRYSGRDDLVVGTPMGGRSRTSLEGLVGFFINTVVLRARLDGTLSFAEFLSRVRETALAAHANQDLPFEKLVEELQPQRELSYSPVFQVMFDLQEEPRWKLPVRTLEVIPEVVFSSRTSSFDLTLSVRQAEHGLDAMFEYDTDLFDATSIERMAQHYQQLLEGIVRDPHSAVQSLPLVDVLAEQQAVRRWHAPVAGAAAGESLFAAFATAAARAPAGIALASDRAHWTYTDLQRYAEAIATTLAGLVAAPEMPVGLLARRTPQTLGAMLGILRAGGTVVPLDPGYPADRLRYMLADAAAGLLLHMPADETLANSIVAADTLLRALPPAAPDTAAQTAPAPAVTGANRAFIMYTSGSTGRPKGVELEHQGLLNYVTQLGQQTRLDANDRLLQFASFSFDIALEEVFAALLHGATLVLRDAAMTQSLPEFVAGCEARRITWMSLPTAWWHELCAGLSRGEVSCPATLRCLIIGGEKAELDAFRVWRAAAPQVRIINTYGPTEASIAAAWCELTYLDADQLADIPIGQPVPNVQLWVMDDQQRLLPPGLPGEICIGGCGIARGYRGLPEQTAARFITVALPDGTRERLYRTGDRGRYGNDGNLMFLGRSDAQIKLRGHRIEPGEVETALSAMPGVERCAVVPYGDAPATVLVAYVTGAVEVTGLQQALRQRLPDYMVPAEIVPLEQLPFTANGKLDRAALPAPSGAGRSSAAYRAPQSATERTLAAIWSAVLNVPQVGCDDDFFALGGHSLVATRVMARVRDELGVDVPLRALFDHPTVARLGLQIDAAATAAAEPLPLTRRAHGEVLLPLASPQRRLWVLHQLEPASTAYHLYAAMQLRGPLALTHLQAALHRLVDRHDALRTVFAEQNGEPVQRVIERLEVPFVVETLPAGDHAWVAERVTQLVDLPFDLATGPLLRAHALQLPARGSAAPETVLLLVLHHIVCDGWSMSLLCSDLSRYYNAAVAGGPLPAALELQYPDYALWEQERLRLPAAAVAEGYWQAQLRTAPPVLELPTDFPRPAVQSYAGAWVSQLIPAALHDALQACANANGASLFMVLLAAFKALLYRHTGRTDLVVGTPVAGRTRTALEPVVGCFLNTLVLRTDCGADPTFAELLTRVRETTLAAYEHQDLPFERLLELLQPPRNPAHTPVVQVLFNLHNERGAGLQLHEVRAEPLLLERAAAKFDLAVAVSDTADGLLCGFEYNTDLFRAATIEQFMAHYLRLLEALAADPGQCIAAVPLAAPAQPRGRPVAAPVFVPEAWSGIGARFAAVVNEHATRPAVRLPGRDVSYAELGARAAAVAAALQAAGLQRGAVVALLLGHDDEMLAGLLGTLLAGCAYVPLDRNLPAARSRELLQSAQADGLLHGAALAEQAAALVAGQGVRVAVPASGDGRPAAAAMCAAAADDLAYILFTSGSTGRPKGVLQTQANVLRHAATYATALQITPADVLTLLPGYGFDAAVMDIFGALLSGAALQPVDLLQMPAAAQARAALAGATVWHCTPTVLRYLLRERPVGEALPHARALVLGGEVARVDDFELFTTHFARGACFVNGYGPSESTLATQFFADHDTLLPGRCVPIGSPVADTEIELLDGDSPGGVSGEIVIRSDRLSPGYLGDTDLTATRFARSGSGIHRRQYRSGDRARRLPDGQLVYLGRLDGQLKLRGYRIEPGEIEAWASRVPGVERCAVVLHDEQLVCFFSGTASSHAIRRLLLAHLPTYMVPQSFARLDELPLRPNGKIARDTLAELAVIPAADTRDTAPQGALEARLADIWRSVLGRSRVGRHDDFFALGGHSLLATQVLARLRDLGYPARLADLFAAPTVAELAGVLAANGDVEVAAPLRPRPAGGSLPPLSFAQQRLWFLAQLEPESAAYHLHWAGRLDGVPDPDLLAGALRCVGQRHEALRTCIHNHPDGPVQVINAEFELALERIALPGAGAATLHGRMRELIRRPFDLTRGPLVRTYLLELSPVDTVLLLVMHHIVSDGWSMGVLFRELSEAYSALAAERTPMLPALPVQYADYAVWQQSWLRGAELERQSAYWKQQLTGAPPLLELPLDYPRPPLQRDRGAWLTRQLPAELAERARELAQAEGATLFMVLLAVFKALLFRYTGRVDLLVGAPVAGRSRTELEPLIGYFLNMLVLRTTVDGDAGFAELLRRVRSTTLAAFDHQDLPFEKLLEICSPPRSIAHTPLVQVSFNLHNEPGGSL